MQLCVGVGLAEKILTKIESYDDMLAGKNSTVSLNFKAMLLIFSFLFLYRILNEVDGSEEKA